MKFIVILEYFKNDYLTKMSVEVLDCKNAVEALNLVYGVYNININTVREIYVRMDKKCQRDMV